MIYTVIVFKINALVWLWKSLVKFVWKLKLFKDGKKYGFFNYAGYHFQLRSDKIDQGQIFTC